MPNQKISRFDKIRTTEICGVTGIHGSDLVISGSNLVISGERAHFREIISDDIKTAPHFMYAFRFGGPATHVSSGVSLGGGDVGLKAGGDAVYVYDSGIFATGDHIIVNPTEYGLQEEHTITGILYDSAMLTGALYVEDTLLYNHNTGTLIANKFAPSGTISTDGCGYSTCYDTRNLYVEYGPAENFMWKASGYRDWFVEESGIKINITGAPNSIIESGLLTFIYPE